MVRPCCICGIKKNSDASSKGIRFFRFPGVKTSLYSEWIQIIRHHSKKLCFVPKRNSIVCSNHFEEHCFNRSKRRLRLREGSKPTIFDDVSKKIADKNPDPSPTPEEVQDIAEDTENISLRLVMEDDTSDSLSPPVLLPLQEVNSDFEENIEDPPDLDMYQLNHDYVDLGLTSFSDLDMIKMDHIGSVADILGPDPYLQDDSITMDERPESSIGEERDEVDGQTILSFASAEEMHEYVARKESGSRLTKTNDLKQIKGWRNKFHQLTPSLSPSPCPSPTSSIPLQSEVPTSTISESPPHTAVSCDVPGSSIEAHENDEGASQGKVKSLQVAMQENEDVTTIEVTMQEKEDVKTIDVTMEEIDLKTVEVTMQEEEERKKVEIREETRIQVETQKESEPQEVEIQKETKPQEEVKAPKQDTSQEEITKKVRRFVNPGGKQPLTLVESIKAKWIKPELGPGGRISAEFAKYAASAVSIPSLERTRQAEKKLEPIPKESKEVPIRPTSLTSRKRRKSEKVTGEVSTTPKRDNDEINFAEFDDSVEDIIVNEDEYQELYDVPGDVVLPNVECGSLFCRLGCICDSLEKATNRSKVSLEHCSLAECMLQCVCGYQKGNPSSRKCFASLLKGNESFYSKINWSSGRRRRERRVPERFSEYHLDHDSTIDPDSPRRATEDPKTKTKGPRGGASSSRPSSPFKGGSPPTRPATQRGVRDSNQPQGTLKKWEPIRIKVCKDEIKLLRWDSFVSLSKVYVAPDQDIFCMEHVVYNCPCIESNRRIIRILSKYGPPFESSEKKTTPLTSPVNNVKATSKVTPPNKNVAKKHTHPNMRFANVPKAKVQKMAEGAAQVSAPAQEPIAKTSSLSKMRKLLQDERFNLPKLMTEEKTRAFDEEVDLNVPQGQTVQLVAWIRFHRIYHADRMHIRFLSRRAGPVILVMRPNEIVAADITCDIQAMQGDQNAPEIVKELLDPCISPEETSRYAFLLCDGVKWELVGCLTLKTPDTPSPPPVKSPVVEITPQVVRQPSPKQLVERALPDEPEVRIEEEPQLTATDVRPPSKVTPSPPALRRMVDPASAQRFNAMEQKRKELEERLIEIKQKLNVPQPKRLSGNMKAVKHKHRTTSAQRATPPAEQPLNSEEVQLLPVPAVPVSTPAERTVRRRRETDTTYLIPDQCILPDDLPRSDSDLSNSEQPVAGPSANKLNLPDLVCPQMVKEPSISMYPAAEKLAMFSRLIQSGGDPSAGHGKYSYFNDSPILGSVLGRSSKQSKPKSKRAPPVPPPPVVPPPESNPPPPPPPPPLARPQEMKMLKLQPVGSNLPSGAPLPNIVRRIRILPPPVASGKGGAASTPVLTSKNGIEPTVIQQQRMHWSSIGVRAPIVANTRSILTANSTITAEEMSVTAVTASSVLLGQSVESSAACRLVNKDMSLLSTVTPVAFIPDAQPQLTALKDTTKEKEDENKSTPLENDVIPETPVVEPPTEKGVFPKVLAAEVSSVQSKGSVTQSLKIILEAITGENQGLCPSRASMLLPLHNVDDRWCLVALDHIPKSGFQVPGLSVFISAELLGRAALAAIERKARVSFPLRFQLKNKNSAFKPGFGVYGTPQLPRHVFVGPFPSDHAENCLPQPCMNFIALTKPVQSNSDFSNASSLLKTLCMKSVEPTTSAAAESKPIEKEETKRAKPESETESGSCQNEVTVVAEKIIQKDEQSTVDCAITPSVDDEIAVVATVSGKTNIVVDQGRESPEANTRKTLMVTDGVKNGGIEIVNNTKVQESRSQPTPPPPSVPLPPAESTSPLKPRKFVARVQGLPATTLAVFPDRVLVKHPFHPEEMLKFTSIDKAKCWLQSLANRTLREEFNDSDKSKTSNSADDSFPNSEPSEEEEVDVCGEDHAQEQEETADSTSTSSRSPNKRVRRPTEKARVLAASKSKPIRHNSRSVLKRPFSMSSSPMVKRSSIQRQLHIRKEQERRGLLSKLLRDLDFLLAPDGGMRAKVVVLKKATTEITHLQKQAKILENTYEELKQRRAALLTQREKIFNTLPDEVKQIFNCLMESTAPPSRHLNSTDLARRSRPRRYSIHERGGRFEVEIPKEDIME